MTAPEGWVPEFEGQRPPFAPGNQLARRHGAYLLPAIDAEQRAVLVEVEELRPGWIAEADAWEVSSWSFAEARCRLLRRVVSDQPLLTATGKPTHANQELRAWEKRAALGRERLGLNPLARGRLGRDVASSAVDLARLGQQGAALVERHAPPEVGS